MSSQVYLQKIVPNPVIQSIKGSKNLYLPAVEGIHKYSCPNLNQGPWNVSKFYCI